MKQGREYDPDAEYIREYVPELADATAADIHAGTTSSRPSASGSPPTIRADRRPRRASGPSHRTLRTGARRVVGVGSRRLVVREWVGTPSTESADEWPPRSAYAQ